MKQSINTQLTDGDLLLYIDGNADPEMVRHIETDPQLQKRVQNLAYLQNYMREHLSSLSCPLTIELGDYHLRMLSDREHMRIKKHIRDCSNCLSRLNELANHIDGPVDIASTTPASENTTENLFGRLGRWFIYPSPKFELTPAAGFLSDTPTVQNRVEPIVYRFDQEPYQGEISIQVMAGNRKREGRKIMGLISGNLRQWLTDVELMAMARFSENAETTTAEPVATTKVNAIGGFVLQKIPSGNYELLLKSGDQSLCLRELQI
ncbi:MAG: hypothetical protein AAF639_17225 [Chloroflexota bacterium]